MHQPILFGIYKTCANQYLLCALSHSMIWLLTGVITEMISHTKYIVIVKAWSEGLIQDYFDHWYLVGPVVKMMHALAKLVSFLSKCWGNACYQCICQQLVSPAEVIILVSWADLLF